MKVELLLLGGGLRLSQQLPHRAQADTRRSASAVWQACSNNGRSRALAANALSPTNTRTLSTPRACVIA